MNTIPNFRSAYHLIRLMLTPERRLMPKCAEMRNDDYSLHFHTFGKWRFWKRAVYLESVSGMIVEINQDQAAYLMVHQPASFGEAMLWLKMYWPEYTFHEIVKDD